MSPVLAPNTQDYETLLQRKQQLSEQLTAVQLFTFTTKFTGIEYTLEEAVPFLLDAISFQRIYGFKNKHEIIFDSYVGLLFTNLNNFPKIYYQDWEMVQNEFSPDGIGKGQWQCLHDLWHTSQVSEDIFWGYESRSWFSISPPVIPKKFLPESGETSFHVALFFNKIENKYYVIDKPPHRSLYITNEIGKFRDIIEDGWLGPFYPAYHILNKKEIFHGYPLTTRHEKAKIILDFFIEQDWIPIFDNYIEQGWKVSDDYYYEAYKDEDENDFQARLADSQAECDQYNRLFEAYYQRIQLQKQLVEIEQQLAELPEPAQTWLSADFNYRPVWAQYPLTEIAQSVWQYSQSAQKWLNTLLEQLDEWESEHHDVISTAQSINAVFAEKLQLSSQLNEQECAVLNEQHQYLKQKLNFSLIPTKQKLIALLEQNQQLEQKLEQTDDLQSLAELEQYSRPSFPLLAEHSATLCTKNLAGLEWLGQNLTFVQDMVNSAEQQREQYLIFIDKYQHDLLKDASDNDIEDEHIQKWLAEWRTERLTLLQQWLPLVKAGLQHELTQDAVRATLECLTDYQQQIDQFYLKSRLSVYTKFAFTANGHRQEQLEKDSELIKLNHQFMQALQKVIFSQSNSREKLWLLNYSEVWQKHIVQEIQVFLQNENLLERDDIAQLMMDDMRKVQQQSLASCLQDAERYSEALEQRNKSVNTLMFKMRKALSTEK